MIPQLNTNFIINEYLFSVSVSSILKILKDDSLRQPYTYRVILGVEC